MARRSLSLKNLILWLLDCYRHTAVWRQPTCRFYPSCSSYAFKSIEIHGLGRGMYLTLLRLLRCHPFHKGGIDEVPPEFHGNRIDHRQHAC